MRIAQIRKYDVANGPGIRTTVFVSGCTHNCKGCFNKEYQDFEYGKPFTKEIEDEIIEYVKETGCLSILGGEPLQQDEQLQYFLQRVKRETNANVWMWTGYTIEQVLSHKFLRNRHLTETFSNTRFSFILAVLENVDFLVDGKFVESKKDLTLKFRGSSNQRIINVKKSLENLKAIEVED